MICQVLWALTFILYKLKWRSCPENEICTKTWQRGGNKLSIVRLHYLSYQLGYAKQQCSSKHLSGCSHQKLISCSSYMPILLCQGVVWCCPHSGMSWVTETGNREGWRVTYWQLSAAAESDPHHFCLHLLANRLALPNCKGAGTSNPPTCTWKGRKMGCR